MNILLVNPHFNGQAEIPPLGLMYLAASLPGEDHHVEILDLDLYPAAAGAGMLAARISGGKTDILGITALSNSFGAAREVCRLAKTMAPKIVTVLGGIHGTILHADIMRECEEIDAVVRGEGEAAFRELCDTVATGAPFDKIPGVSFRREGRIITNPERRLDPDLDALPLPAHRLVEINRYRTQSISSSRGCPHHCRFCSIRSLYDGEIRRRSSGSLAAEIAALQSQGARRIMFTDDNFTADARRVGELCDAIVAAGLHEHCEFYLQGRIDDFCRRPVMAQWLSDAGFKAVYTGAESGAEEILARYGKDITPADLRRGVSCCVEQNLMPVVSFILFGPWDTVATMTKTIRLAKELFENGADIAYTECLIPFPGTPVKEELVRDGRWRQEAGAYYFTSYTGMDLDWVLRACDLARRMAQAVHGGDPFFALRRVYHEFSFLEDILPRRVPPAYQQWLSTGQPDVNPAVVRDIASALRGFIERDL